LRRCLDSVRDLDLPFVYVDSDSTDGSLELARERGVEIVSLDLSRPFTAARARNEGFERLRDVAPNLAYVQFVDGDCELATGWLDLAAKTLDEREDVAAVCGRRREKFPDATPYNRMADMEWNTEIGEADACGGDVMMRTALFAEEGGYDPGLISGEEPELCLRYRKRGFKILRLDAEMTLHDAAMTRLSQWWKRAKRSGWAAGERLVQHGLADNPRHVRRALSSIAWGMALPLGALLSALFIALVFKRPLLGALPLALFAAGLAVLHGRIRRYRKGRGDASEHASMYARFTVLGKLPEGLGVIQGAWSRWRGNAARWIEYKDVVPLESSASPKQVADEAVPR
ncbi:MAG: glycosyltransferase, partial [Planctomycetota bacterium]